MHSTRIEENFLKLEFDILWFYASLLGVGYPLLVSGADEELGSS